MRILVILACFLASGCLAQKPRPCRSPPLLTGAVSVSTQNEKLLVYAKYLYDGLGERIRLFEFGTYENKSFTADVLLLFREEVMYEIDDKSKTCVKKPLKADFQPMEIPQNASLLGQVILGSSSGPGQGLLVNTWMGDLPNDAGKYIVTVTEFGCIPVSEIVHTEQFGWMLTSYFNNVIGISDPDKLNPPDFCLEEDVNFDNKEKPVDFFSLFLDKN
ncbi:hypothetical protein LDENG_00012650 [Lucifuga dentata]|nr:hypothetical protein LDENG_00012650 [Lucifuga dentata]